MCGETMNSACMRNSKIFLLRRIFIATCLLFTAPATFASSGGAAFAEGVNYLPIKPALVVNYGGPGKVKYIKAEISMRVDDAHAAEEVTHHMPLVRDTLIMLLSSMTDEQVSSGEGKEQMRQQALAKVNEALTAQMGHDDKKVDDEASKDGHADKGKKEEKVGKGKDEKSKKDTKSKKTKADDEDKKAVVHKALVTDLLFDNLVVQR
ncbi:MAG: hypothetical protein EOO68_04860 [Moraxellaceae bacterium]|nr:MAG: hypothetical protein EOO68_04860 [Moraxellaceae bacterium]